MPTTGRSGGRPSLARAAALADDAAGARLDRGLLGQWNPHFTESLINVHDIDGNPWQYFAIEKKPEQPQGLILFLHGFPEFAYAWEEQLEHFGNTHHAVAIDLK